MPSYGTVEIPDKDKQIRDQGPAMTDSRSGLRALTPYFAFVLLIAMVGPLLFGFHLTELNAPKAIMTCKRTTPIKDKAMSTSLPKCIPMTEGEFGLVTSIFTPGGLIGALVAGPLSAKHGRLPTMRWTTVLFMLGPAFQAAAPNIATLIAGRFISGLGAGASMVVAPVYIWELSPPGQKGFFGTFSQVMVNFGIVVAQLLGYFLSRGQYWRVIFGAAGMFGLLQLVGLLFAVESPRWTTEQGHQTRAKKDLRKIRGNNYDVEGEVITWGVIPALQAAEEEETLLSGEGNPGAALAKKSSKVEPLSMVEVLRHPDTAKAAVAVIMVMLAQQLTGINSIVMYGVDLLAGLLESNSAVLNLVVSALNMLVTIIAAPMTEKLGRKFCLLQSIGGMGVASLLLGFGMAKSIPVLSAVAVMAFVAAFSLGLGPVPWILSSELVGPEAVDATQSLALSANWIATGAVAQFFPIVQHALGSDVVYFIFAGLALFFFLFTLWWVPETMGKKDADEVWGRERRSD